MAAKADRLLRLARLRALTASGAAQSIRLAAGLSLREVAEAAGVEVSTLWRWENAERVPSNSPGALKYQRLLQRLLDEQRGGKR